MSKRKKVLVTSILSLFVFIVAVILTSPYGGGICGDEKYCFEPFDEIIGQPFGFFSIITFFLSVIFLFVQEPKFTSWLRFAKYYLPIAAILIFIFPTVDSTIGGFDREFMTWVLSGLFFLLSLGIIIFSAKGGSAFSGKR